MPNSYELQRLEVEVCFGWFCDVFAYRALGFGGFGGTGALGWEAYGPDASQGLGLRVCAWFGCSPIKHKPSMCPYF